MNLIDRYDLVLSDLDGVVYRGTQGISSNIEALNELKRRGKALGYITNNASRPEGVIVEQLRHLGLDAEATEVLSSAQVVIPALAGFVAPGDRVLVIGGDGLHEQVRSAGYRVVRQVTDDPAAVVQGFAPEVTYAELVQVAYAVQRGLPWLATNDDRTVPKEHGNSPGNGAMIRAVHWATGEFPQVVGKPEVAIFEAALQRWRPTAPLFIGDRLDTDVLGARRSAIDSLFVLTGVDRPRALIDAKGSLRPTYIVDDLSQLLQPYPEVQRRGGQVWVGEAGVELSAGRAVRILAGEPEAINTLRATCALVWKTAYGFSGVSVPRVIWDR